MCVEKPTCLATPTDHKALTFSLKCKASSSLYEHET